MPELQLLEHTTTRAIIGAFYYVYNRLGHGFLESVYQTALANTLERTGHRVDREVELLVYFEEAIVGKFRADLVVDDRVLLEVKAATQISAPHEGQVINYLRASGLPVGLLLNFGPQAAYRRFVGPAANNCQSVSVD